MERHQALFEPERKAGGYVGTFPDFGADSVSYGTIRGSQMVAAMYRSCSLLSLK